MDEETLFHAALAIPIPADRAAFLDRACGDDLRLRSAVESLLAAHDASGPFLDAEAVTLANLAADPPTSEPTAHALKASPPSIAVVGERDPEAQILIAGRYTLLEKIGEGGMGEVWVAKQSEPVKRRVALKLIKPGMDSRAVLQRFEQERQALAVMDHTNIAKVFDAGMTPDGQPFFAMELVNGLPLGKFCDEVRLTPRERLELFVPICQAVQHAHQKGIVHRDLKPANILVTMIDGRPVPKVIDFGVAKATAGKLTDESLSTQFGAVLGTLEYMSPEQAGYSGEDIDTRSDIYSLGVILYELLTGLRPIDSRRLKQAALVEMIRIVREEEPSRPSTRLSTDEALPSLAALRQTDPRKLMAILRGDLDWVVMKCLEKPRDRRYETANALVRDIQRYLDGEPVEACPPSRRYRLGKFARRHRAALATAGAFALLLVATTTVSAVLAVRANRERVRAVKAEAASEDRERMAIDSVKRFGDVIVETPELKDDPSLADLRTRLLKEPQGFFLALRDRLRNDRDTRPESLARLASAYFNLGLLSGEIGDQREALAAYRESLALREALAATQPAVARYQSSLALSHHNIGVQLRATGKPADALAAFESSLAISRKLADAHPTVAQLQSDLAASYYKIGIVLSETGKPSDALAAYESALAIQRRLADAHPAVAQYQNEQAMSHNTIGLLLSETGRPTEALAAYESSLAIRRRLADAHPTVARYQSGLAITHHGIGNLLDETGKSAEALAAYESSLAISRKLADAHPAVTQYQNDLAATHDNIGNLLRISGKLAEALAAQESALVIRRRLADAHPTVAEYRSSLAASYLNIGILLRQTGNSTESLAAYESALAIWRTLARDHPESPDYASNLGGALNNLSQHDWEANRFEVARARLGEAVRWQRKALAANPTNPTYRQFLANHLTCQITVARGMRDAQGAAEAERELAQLRDGDPKQLAVAWKALDARLSAILRGDQLPKDDAERLTVAQVAYDQALHATAARFWGEALANNPKLGDDRHAQHRYHAACAAALAGCGRGKDQPARDDAARAKLRAQAREWLKAELKAWQRVAMTVGQANKLAVAHALADWKRDADLGGIRDEAGLAALAEDERSAFAQLWNDVDALLGKVAATR